MGGINWDEHKSPASVVEIVREYVVLDPDEYYKKYS